MRITNRQHYRHGFGSINTNVDLPLPALALQAGTDATLCKPAATPVGTPEIRSKVAAGSEGMKDISCNVHCVVADPLQVVQYLHKEHSR